MCKYMLVSLCTKLYMITCVNVEDRGSAKGYGDSFREAEGDDAFGENLGDDARGDYAFNKIHFWNEPRLGMFSIIRNVKY